MMIQPLIIKVDIVIAQKRYIVPPFSERRDSIAAYI